MTQPFSNSKAEVRQTTLADERAADRAQERSPGRLTEPAPPGRPEQRIAALAVQHRRPDGRGGADERAPVAQRGLIEGLLIARRYRYLTVPAQRWQKALLGKVPKGGTKAAAEAFARKLWPDLASWAVPAGCRTLQDGIIDGALLAEFARRQRL